MFSKRGFGPNCMVILAVDSTARPFECDIGEKPHILAGYREFNLRARPTAGPQRRASTKAWRMARLAWRSPPAPFIGYATCDNARSNGERCRRRARSVAYTFWTPT